MCFILVGQDDQMTTVRCKDFIGQDQENALVQKDSSVKKNPIVVQVHIHSCYSSMPYNL